MPLTLPRSGGRNVPTEGHRNEDTSLTQPLPRGSRCLSSSLFRGQEQMPLTLPRSGGRNVPTEDHRNEDTSLTQPLSRVEQMHLI
jgi:hypothetical protein